RQSTGARYRWRLRQSIIWRGRSWRRRRRIRLDYGQGVIHRVHHTPLQLISGSKDPLSHAIQLCFNGMRDSLESRAALVLRLVCILWCKHLSKLLHTKQRHNPEEAENRLNKLTHDSIPLLGSMSSRRMRYHKHSLPPVYFASWYHWANSGREW